MSPSILDFKGSYHGFGPTDESATRFGELELEVTAEGIKGRFATGHHIEDVNYPVERIILTAKQLDPSRHIVCFTLSNDLSENGGSGVQFCFFTKPSVRDPSLIIQNWVGDFVHPTMLVNRKRKFACASRSGQLG